MKVKIIQDPMNGDRWQVRYQTNTGEPWYDYGDGKDTREEAETALARFKAEKATQEGHGK